MARSPAIPRVARVSWNELDQQLRSTWQQGEHFSILAPTYGGKTVMAVKGLLPLWPHVMMLDGKGDDHVLESFGKTVDRYPTGFLTRFDDTKKYRIFPHYTDDRPHPVFGDALDHIWRDKEWTVYIDELRLFTDPRYFGLLTKVERLWLFGRSKGLTVIAGSQAPRWLPSAFYDQARHFLIGYMRDRRALTRLDEIGGDVDLVKATVPSLRRYEFLYVSEDENVRVKYPFRQRAA